MGTRPPPLITTAGGGDAKTTAAKVLLESKWLMGILKGVLVLVLETPENALTTMVQHFNHDALTPLLHPCAPEEIRVWSLRVLCTSLLRRPDFATHFRSNDGFILLLSTLQYSWALEGMYRPLLALLCGSAPNVRGKLSDIGNMRIPSDHHVDFPEALVVLSAMLQYSCTHGSADSNTGIEAHVIAFLTRQLRDHPSFWRSVLRRDTVPRFVELLFVRSHYRDNSSSPPTSPVLSTGRGSACAPAPLSETASANSIDSMIEELAAEARAEPGAAKEEDASLKAVDAVASASSCGDAVDTANSNTTEIEDSPGEEDVDTAQADEATGPGFAACPVFHLVVEALAGALRHGADGVGGDALDYTLESFPPGVPLSGVIRFESEVLHALLRTYTEGAEVMAREDKENPSPKGGTSDKDGSFDVVGLCDRALDRVHQALPSPSPNPNPNANPNPKKVVLTLTLTLTLTSSATPAKVRTCALSQPKHGSSTAIHARP